ncbi:TetR/AcrR family transcriptional regulator [Chthonobacter rhizosphaerae]|uniref:TetR/AcrR family transcriptional regulator n=1 Tax=Chthonobacter rhizosphaerae TaxID=2735553 RepID=UPI0015EED503|nr:TetR/AcrR family transcriptional regulator [Chthonobacter rhizosphaerae]
MAITESSKARRKTRADSIRNRERLLAAAADVFGVGDGQASLEAVARKAGVGIGTLYRHFPTREALFEAAYRHEVDQLAALAEDLAAGSDPVDALRRWMQANVRLVATKRGMVETLQLAAYGSSELKAYSSERLLTAARQLVERGVAAGVIRGDIPAEDLLRALAGILYAQTAGDWQPAALRLIDVLVDGMRAR